MGKLSGILDLFKRRKRKDPEDDFIVTITDVLIKVEYPGWVPAQVRWEEIREIKLINTDQGPWMPDIWLVLSGEDSRCTVPHGAKGFDDIYEVISKFEGFNHENFGKSMTCTDNAEYILWVRDKLTENGA